MKRVTLGRTGLSATIIGLGSGGLSRLGTGREGKGNDNAESVVRAALDAGVNLIDTAEAYGTESIIGAALGHGRPHDLILSTKLSYRIEERLKTTGEVEASLDASLKNLGADCIDIYHVHGVRSDHYAAVVDTILPFLWRMREKGKLRFIGITEVFSSDTDHRMLRQAIRDSYWDVVMVGYNLLNSSARAMLFDATRAQGIGTLCMFAVRQALINLAKLETYLHMQVVDKGVDARVLDAVPLLRELLESGGSGSLTEAAYRYCRHEPGIDVVLAGTGSVDHLRQNIQDIDKPILPASFIARMESIFKGITSLSGQ